MDNLEKFVNKSQTYIWGGLTIIALGAVIFAGATHQLLMAGISYIMYLASKDAASEAKAEDKASVNNQDNE